VVPLTLWHDECMKARRVWLLTLPFLLLSESLGHALVARMVDSEGARHHLVLGGMVDYDEYAHAALAVLIVLAGAALVQRMLASFRTGGTRLLPAWRLAAVPPLVFLAQEHVERLVQDGDLGWLTAVEPVVLVGVALQVPCGLLALWLARALLRAADELGCALARRSSAAARRPPGNQPVFVHASPFRLRALASRHAGRAPPVLA